MRNVITAVTLMGTLLAVGQIRPDQKMRLLKSDPSGLLFNQKGSGNPQTILLSTQFDGASSAGFQQQEQITYTYNKQGQVQQTDKLIGGLNQIERHTFHYTNGGQSTIDSMFFVQGGLLSWRGSQITERKKDGQGMLTELIMTHRYSSADGIQQVKMRVKRSLEKNGEEISFFYQENNDDESLTAKLTLSDRNKESVGFRTLVYTALENGEVLFEEKLEDARFVEFNHESLEELNFLIASAKYTSGNLTYQINGSQQGAEFVELYSQNNTPAFEYRYQYDSQRHLSACAYAFEWDVNQRQFKEQSMCKSEWTGGPSQKQGKVIHEIKGPGKSSVVTKTIAATY
ncbi:MAG TPA: hypothetical protein VFV37_00655 [Luteibaculaceae bacterium]|nr:hypothetical protein [Luteibaculaceae bacterium]